MMSNSISLKRATSIDSRTKEKLEDLSRKLVDNLYYKIMCNQEIKIIEYGNTIERIPDANKHLFWHLDTHVRIRDWARFSRQNKAFYKVIYNLLLEEIDTDGRVIQLVPE